MSFNGVHNISPELATFVSRLCTSLTDAAEPKFISGCQDGTQYAEPSTLDTARAWYEEFKLAISQQADPFLKHEYNYAPSIGLVMRSQKPSATRLISQHDEWENILLQFLVQESDVEQELHKWRTKFEHRGGFKGSHRQDTRSQTVLHNELTGPPTKGLGTHPNHHSPPRRNDSSPTRLPSGTDCNSPSSSQLAGSSRDPVNDEVQKYGALDMSSGMGSPNDKTVPSLPSALRKEDLDSRHIPFRSESLNVLNASILSPLKPIFDRAPSGMCQVSRASVGSAYLFNNTPNSFRRDARLLNFAASKKSPGGNPLFHDTRRRPQVVQLPNLSKLEMPTHSDRYDATSVSRMSRENNSSRIRSRSHNPPQMLAGPPSVPRWANDFQPKEDNSERYRDLSANRSAVESLWLKSSVKHVISPQFGLSRAGRSQLSQFSAMGSQGALTRETQSAYDRHWLCRGNDFSSVALRKKIEITDGENSTLVVSRKKQEVEPAIEMRRDETSQSSSGSLIARVAVTNARLNYKCNLPPHLKVTDKDIVIKEPISEGTFGSVFKAQWKGIEVAVKLFRTDNPPTIEQLRNFEREVNAYCVLDHERICKFYGASSESWDKLLIITEYLSKGNVFELFFERTSVFPSQLRLKMARQLASAIEYLHGCRPVVVHRDIKTPNLVLSEEYDLKLCDFGKTKFMHRSYLILEDNGGSPRYMAPEAFVAHGCITEKSDIWSLACCLIEIFGGPIPHEQFYDNETVIENILGNHMKPMVPQWFHPAVISILNKCFETDYRKRPSAKEVGQVLATLTATDLDDFGMNKRRVQ